MLELLVLLLISAGNADKLDRLYLPPPNASLAGGRPGDIEVPFESLKKLEDNQNVFPQSTSNNFESDVSITETDYSTPISSSNNEPSSKISLSTSPTYSELNTFPQRGLDHNQGTFLENSFSDNHSNVSLQQSNNTPNKFLKAEFNNGLNNPESYFVKNTDSNPDNVQTAVNQNSQENIKNTTAPLRPVFITPNSMPPTKYNIQYPITGPIFNADNNKQISYPHQNTLHNEHLPNLENTIQQFPERIQAEADRNSVILKYDSVITPGSYAYSYETSNGIKAEENGTVTDGTKAKGSYSYIGDDGKNYTVIYTADENGFQPHGDHLPTSPPIPDAIKKALEHIAENEKNGIFDDGSYDENKYGHKNYQPPEFGINGKKYFNLPNNPNNRNNNLISSIPTKQLSQSEPEVQPIAGGQSFIDNHNYDLDEDSDYEDDSDEFAKPINSNGINPELSDQVTHQVSQHMEGHNDPTKPGVPNYNSFHSLADQVPNNDEEERLQNLKDVNDFDVNSSTFKPTTTGYQYFPPQIKFTSQTNSFPSRFADVFKTSTYKPISIISQSSENVDENFQNDNTGKIGKGRFDSFKKRPDQYNNKVSPGTNNNLSNISNKQAYASPNANPLDDIFRRKNVYPTVNKEFSLHDSFPNEYSDLNSRYYSTTPTNSQFPSLTATYKPRDGNGITEDNLNFSTTNKPSLFTNGPVKTETDSESFALPSYTEFQETTKPKEISNKFGYPINNIFQSTETPSIDGTELKNKNYLSPQYISTTTNGPPANINHSSYQPNPAISGNQPSTEKNIREDFSGPKRPQIYDPATGYYYK